MTGSKFFQGLIINHHPIKTYGGVKVYDHRSSSQHLISD
jgi:hypothetical protein